MHSMVAPALQAQQLVTVLQVLERVRSVTVLGLQAL